MECGKVSKGQMIFKRLKRAQSKTMETKSGSFPAMSRISNVTVLYQKNKRRVTPDVGGIGTFRRNAKKRGSFSGKGQLDGLMVWIMLKP
jgi:hypothetical protein